MWPVVEQNKAVSLLQRSLERGLSHAYLFVGPPHMGKLALALSLAQALNCEGETAPCNECPSCQKIAAGKHADVLAVGLGSNGASGRSRTEIGIEQVRQIQHAASLPPFEGRHKVFIIDGAERLSLEAANCLLKTLEEVEGKVVFILLAASDRWLPATVVSRCQRLEMLPPSAAEVEDNLCRQRNLEPARARLLTRLSGNRLGWALAAASDDGLLHQRAERIDQLVQVIDADYTARFLYAAELARQFNQDRQSVYEVLDSWLSWWRDLLLVSTGNAAAVTALDYEEALSQMAGDYPLDTIRRTLGHIQQAQKELRQNANARLVLEVLMLGMPRRDG